MALIDPQKAQFFTTPIGSWALGTPLNRRAGGGPHPDLRGTGLSAAEAPLEVCLGGKPGLSNRREDLTRGFLNPFDAMMLSRPLSEACYPPHRGCGRWGLAYGLDIFADLPIESPIPIPVLDAYLAERTSRTWEWVDGRGRPSRKGKEKRGS